MEIDRAYSNKCQEKTYGTQEWPKQQKDIRNRKKEIQGKEVRCWIQLCSEVLVHAQGFLGPWAL